ncbi:SGNH/GDSL hydrolase family protein [Bacillus rubiinfantis]|uniref:SGNH/GDSL hydrolase family protein n=1 Tax=Bacillus rubiinfantis TaxID=1499680 RepID=UPI0005A63841|nr:SGNH/GDSL hydrolase family protein [Bacillus rubiinfantis]
MKKIFTPLILSSFLLASCSETNHLSQLPAKKTVVQAYAPIPADFAPRNLTVLSAGDSLTQGVGDSTNKGGYLPYLETMLEKEKGINEVDFYNYGVKGNRTTQLLKRLKSQEMQPIVQKADLIILTIGGNDIMKVVRDHFSDLKLADFMTEKEVYQHRLTEIMQTILSENPDASIVLVGMYNPFSKWFSHIKEMDEIVSLWNKAAQTVVANYPNAYFVGIDDVFLKTNDDLLYTDHFHPNNKGYKLIAKKLSEALGDRVIPDLEKKPLVVSTEEN